MISIGSILLCCRAPFRGEITRFFHLRRIRSPCADKSSWSRARPSFNSCTYLEINDSASSNVSSFEYGAPRALDRSAERNCPMQSSHVQGGSGFFSDLANGGSKVLCDRASCSMQSEHVHGGSEFCSGMLNSGKQVTSWSSNKGGGRYGRESFRTGDRTTRRPKREGGKPSQFASTHRVLLARNDSMVPCVSAQQIKKFVHRFTCH